MKAKVWKGAGKHPWRWHIKASNGEILSGGEGYATRADCVRGMRLATSLRAWVAARLVK